MGTIRKEDDYYADSLEETFMSLTLTSQDPFNLVSEARREPRARAIKEGWSCAKLVIIYEGVKRALRTLEAFKTTGTDCIYSVLLQESMAQLIPHIGQQSHMEICTTQVWYLTNTKSTEAWQKAT